MMNSPLRFLLLIPVTVVLIVSLLVFLLLLYVLPVLSTVAALVMLGVGVLWWFFGRGKSRPDRVEGEINEPWSTRERV